jgi:hypothetical protein
MKTKTPIQNVSKTFLIGHVNINLNPKMKKYMVHSSSSTFRTNVHSVVPWYL